MQDVEVVIMAGGQGTRFWPISRLRRPKQFLSISPSGESLIQATARRSKPLIGDRSVVILTNKLHEGLIREHVPSATVICEPVGKNTAPTIGLAAVMLARKNPNSIMVVLPADHAVEDDAKLRETLQAAIDIAREQEVLVTVGILPSSPHTGYGYIKRAKAINSRAYTISRFFEKPNLERAKKYVEGGDFYWNSGMFVWRAGVILKAFEEHMPELYKSLMEIAQDLGTEREQGTIEKVFNALEGTSIDFGILEHARNGVVVEGSEFGWDDVGSWDSWSANFQPDGNGNLLHGNALALDSHNCVVHSEHRLIAVLGSDNMIVIDSGDAILVCPRSRVQDVRKIVDELKRQKKDNLI